MSRLPQQLVRHRTGDGANLVDPRRQREIMAGPASCGAVEWLYLAPLAVATLEHASGPRHTSIGDEELLAVDLVTRDRVLALSRNQPIDEGFAQVRLHMRVLGGVHQYHGILVEQPRGAISDDIKFAAGRSRDP